MRLTLILYLVCLLLIVYTLPYDDKMALANSINFGKNKQEWGCKVCDKSNQPLKFNFFH